MSPSLPKEMSQFNVTTITWNDMFAYCMTGRKIRWTGYAEPSHPVIRQLIGISSLIQFIIKSSHRLLGCNKGWLLYISHIQICRFNSSNLMESMSAYTSSCKMCPHDCQQTYPRHQWIHGPEKGIYIAVAESKCHSRVGLAEATIHKVEHALFHLFPGSPQCLNLFKFNHYLTLIEVYLNQQPVYTDHDSYLTPYLWDMASLKRC